MLNRAIPSMTRAFIETDHGLIGDDDLIQLERRSDEQWVVLYARSDGRCVRAFATDEDVRAFRAILARRAYA